ncbi:hypothetical protein BDW62DRAFT_123232 [Aspergillus aurantiobrunneus]
MNIFCKDLAISHQLDAYCEVTIRQRLGYRRTEIAGRDESHSAPQTLALLASSMFSQACGLLPPLFFPDLEWRENRKGRRLLAVRLAGLDLINTVTAWILTYPTENGTGKMDPIRKVPILEKNNLTRGSSCGHATPVQKSCHIQTTISSNGPEPFFCQSQLEQREGRTMEPRG